MEKYDHKKIEKKWQEKWKKEQTFVADDASDKEKFYLLVEFPYPSGNLHVGHWYAFAVPDIFARYLRMCGKNVLFPIGFDAFGLPAENAAIKRGLNPRVWTYENIDFMRNQIHSMGASFDWSREVVTCDPKYYKWTQWQFIELYKKGLVYRKETAVNWCPNDKTVLANEQVAQGHCERCNAEIEKRLMPQWNMKITDYADRLIDDLVPLNWSEQIKDSQRNWIGRSDGAEIDFELKFTFTPDANENRGPHGEKAKLTVFTTRPDTLFGATYLVLAPEHLWVTQATDQNHNAIENKDEVLRYIVASSKKSELERAENKEKTGVEIKGIKAINPANKEEVPIFVADYVLGGYGTGAIMAVPAHDERDGAFAKKFDLPIREVIEPLFIRSSGEDALRKDEKIEKRDAVACIIKHWSEDKYLCVRWKSVPWRGFVTGGLDGEDVATAGVREIQEETGYKNIKFIRTLGDIVNVQFYHVNKQTNRWARFTGAYFELQNNECEEISEKEKAIHDLEWVPYEDVENFITAEDIQVLWSRFLDREEPYTSQGILTNSDQFNGLNSEEAKLKITEFVSGRMTKQYHLRDWVVSRQRYWGAPIPMVHCDACAAAGRNDGWLPVPEKQLPVVLPEVADYLPTGDGKSPLAKVRDWVEVPCPACGKPAERETDTLDTFVDSSWYYLRYTDPTNEQEFATKEKISTWMPIDVYSGGSEHTTMHVLYSRFWHKALFDAGLVTTSEPYARRMNRGLIMGPDGQKMSKSKGNVIDPDEVVSNLGADTVRMYLAFIGPYNELGAYPWNPNGAVGIRRFLERVWSMAEAIVDKPLSESTEVLLTKTVQKVGEDIASLKMNTAVSALMILSNHLQALPEVPKVAFETFIKLLHPFAPHLTSELVCRPKLADIDLLSWPTFDPSKLNSSLSFVAVQINGKLRATIQLSMKATEEEATAAARTEVHVSKWLENTLLLKVIFIPGKIINFVVKQ